MHAIAEALLVSTQVVGSLLVKGIVRVSISKEGGETNNDGAESQDGHPIAAKNVEANVAFPVDVRVVQLRLMIARQAGISKLDIAEGNLSVEAETRTYHSFALGARSLDGELIRDSDDEVVGSSVPRRSVVNNLDGDVEDHVRVRIRERDGGTRSGVQVEIRDV